jgi:hypothetical protein
VARLAQAIKPPNANAAIKLSLYVFIYCFFELCISARLPGSYPASG